MTHCTWFEAAGGPQRGQWGRDREEKHDTLLCLDCTKVKIPSPNPFKMILPHIVHVFCNWNIIEVSIQLGIVMSGLCVTMVTILPQVQPEFLKLEEFCC